MNKIFFALLVVLTLSFGMTVSSYGAGPCPHTVVQQYTEICLQCGKNVYQADAEERAEREAQAQAAAPAPKKKAKRNRKAVVQEPVVPVTPAVPASGPMPPAGKRFGPHGSNIQQYTEMCLDCGENIYAVSVCRANLLPAEPPATESEYTCPVHPNCKGFCGGW